MRDFVKKIGGRKYCSMILMVLLVCANDALSLGFAEETLTRVTTVVLGWVLGESLIDASSALLVRPRADSAEESTKGKKKPSK